MKKIERYKIKEFKIRWSKRYNKLIKIPLKDKEERTKKYHIPGESKPFFKDPELNISECTESFMKTNKGARKKDGRIKLHKGIGQKDSKNEKETANWMSKELGWDVYVDKENTRGEGKSYVDIFNGRKWWEEKSPETREGIRKRTKSALHQLTEMPSNTRGGMIININKENSKEFERLTNEEIKRIVISAINETSRIDCYAIVRRDGDVAFILRCKHN